MSVLPVIVSALALLAVLAVIYWLTHQDVEGTGDVAWRVERVLMRIVPPTGTGEIGEPTWAGLTIRKLAHIGEYAALGIVALALAQWLWGPCPLAFAVAAGFCLAASLADEVQKIFVDGRYFDAHDLLLDAVGYGSVVAIRVLVAMVQW